MNISQNLSPQDINHILNFWFEEITPEQWWRSADLDNLIEKRFLQTYTALKESIPEEWLITAQGHLAAIIALDQFPRNIFRNKPASFATDRIALNIAQAALEKGLDKDLSENEKTFLYMPFQHSEEGDDQKKSISLYKALGNQDSYEFALQHKEIIDRFGRFPHRNEIIGRTSTAEEIAFLKEGALFW